MMRLTLTLLLLISIVRGTFAQEAYDIKVKIDGFEEEEMYLGYFYADKQYLKDTVQRNEQGYFNFKGESPLDAGVYLVLLPPDNQWFQVLLDKNKQQFTIETALPDLAGNVKVSGSADNELLYEYMDFLNQQRPISSELNEKLQAAKAASEPTEKIVEQLEAINQKVMDYQAALVERHPETLTAALVKANMLLEEPERFKQKDLSESEQVARWRWNQQHYFDHVNLSDPRMLRTPFLFNKVNEYVDKMVVQHPDTISLAIDRVLGLMKPAPETFKYYLVHFLNKFAASKIVGMDAVYVHIVENYYAKGFAPWTEEEQLEKIVDNAEKLKPTLIGKTAPNITLEKRDKQRINLHDVASPYTILFIWDPDCGHCKKSMPDVKQFYQDYKDKGVEVFAICNKSAKRDEDGNITLEEVEKCWDYIEENEIGEWINLVDPYNRSRYKSKYFIQSTPQIFILDKDKKIISKRLAAEQLSEVMDQIIQVEQRKAMQGDD